MLLCKAVINNKLKKMFFKAWFQKKKKNQWNFPGWVDFPLKKKKKKKKCKDDQNGLIHPEN